MERSIDYQELSPQARSELERQLRLLYSCFSLFAQNKYQIGERSSIFQNKRQIDMDGLVQKRIKEFLSEGRAYSTYRFFQITIGGQEALSEYLPSCDEHRDFYFLLRFIRYENNEELILEIEKLAEICSFSFTKLRKNTYLVDFSH